MESFVHTEWERGLSLNMELSWLPPGLLPGCKSDPVRLGDGSAGDGPWARAFHTSPDSVIGGHGWFPCRTTDKRRRTVCYKQMREACSLSDHAR